jgi:6-phosphogluconolactonase (cycloisomerase 2 family)
VALLGCWFAIGTPAHARVGDIQFGGCLTVSPQPASGCTDVTATNAQLRGARPLAISPDGRSVYVGASDVHVVSHFRRNPSGGGLTFANCVAGGAQPPPVGCTSVSPPTATYEYPLASPWSLAVSPDGGTVQVTSLQSNDVASFVREAGSGTLGFRGCRAHDLTFTAGCTQALPLDGAVDVAVSPDSRDVYTAASGSHTIAHYRVEPTGWLTPVDCIASSPSTVAGCANVPGMNALVAVGSVALSADGRHLYTAAGDLGVVSQFARDRATGTLSFVGCISASISPGTTGCLDISGTTDVLTGASRLTLSPDGSSLYVASFQRDAIAVFARDTAGGGLAFKGCIAAGDGPSRGCGAVRGTDALEAVGAITVSPEGSSLYALSAPRGAISLFRRNRSTGDLAFGGCITAGTVAATGCSDISGSTNALWQAAALGVSPDGRNVYVTGYWHNALAWFSREPGAEDGGEPPTARRDTVRPVLSRVSVFPRKFAVARAVQRAATVAKRIARRTTFRYRLSEAARVRFAIKRRAVRRRGRGCRKQRCIRFKAAGALSQRGKAGRNRKRFNGRLNGRGLRPGFYRATLHAVDAAGNRSRARHVTFWVVRTPPPR